MPIPLRLRGVLLRHTLAVGILPNTQHCMVLHLRSCNDGCVPADLRHQAGILPPLSPDPSDLSTILEQMPLNSALRRELMRAQHHEDTFQWCGEMRLVFLVTPRTEAPLERFLNRHFCDHVVVIDGFAIEHNVDYSLVVRQPVTWGRGTKKWNFDDLEQCIYRDRHGLAVLVRAIALSPLDAQFSPDQPYLFFTASDCRVHNVPKTPFPAAAANTASTAADGAAPVAFQNMLLGLNRPAYDLRLAGLSLADLSLADLSLSDLSLSALSASALSPGKLSGDSTERQNHATITGC